MLTALHLSLYLLKFANESYQRATEALAGMEDRDTVLGHEAIATKRGAVVQFQQSLDEAIRWCDTAMEELGTISDDPGWRQWVEDREAMIAHDPTLGANQPSDLATAAHPWHSLIETAPILARKRSRLAGR